MTSVDILFWLLLLLMGGITWAIEAGLGFRHRAVMGSSMLAALGSAAIIMFVIEDNSQLGLPSRTEMVKKVDQGSEEVEERGEVDFGGDKSGRRKRVTRSANAADNNSKVERRDVPVVDDGKIVYSREPFKDCPMCPEMVIVSAGSAFIGSPAAEVGRADNEPEAKMTTFEKGFAMGRLEVTRAEFAAFAKAADYKTTTSCETGRRRGTFDWLRPGFEQDERHAVVCVSVRDVEAYLNWVSLKSGRNYQLPSAAEWEFAARGGSDAPYWLGDTLHRTQANVGRTRDGTMPTGVFAANNYGLSDVIGNAAEMTGSCIQEEEEAKSAPATAEKPPCRRIVKGGSWQSSLAAARHAAISHSVDGSAQNFVGFRVMRYTDERDDHRILSHAEKVALAKAEALAAEMEQKEKEAALKAERDAREAAFSTAAAKKTIDAAKAKSRADAQARKDAALVKKVADDEKKAKAKAKGAPAKK